MRLFFSDTFFGSPPTVFCGTGQTRPRSYPSASFPKGPGPSVSWMSFATSSTILWKYVLTSKTILRRYWTLWVCSCRILGR